MKLPPKETEGEMVQDLPAPFNVQKVLIRKTVALSWSWQIPEHSPDFTSFGYEVQRDSQTLVITSKLGETDFEVPPGRHVYRVRARGTFRKDEAAHVSEWSEPMDITLTVGCEHAPIVMMKIEPTKQTYTGLPSLRVHISGEVKVPDHCSLTNLAYHIDSGMGVPRTGLLTVNDQGKFDEYVDAIGPDEELPSETTPFTFTVTAEDEIGTTTSNAYILNLQRQNPYAPQ